MIESDISEAYLVSDKITPVNLDQLRELEKFVGGVLPSGYREYMLRFGTSGEYMEVLEVWSPEMIMAHNDQWRSNYGDQYVDHKNKYARDSVLTDDDLRTYFTFAHTDSGDTILYCPRFPGELFMYHREVEPIHRIARGFHSSLELSLYREGTDCFRYFVPSSHQTATEIIDLGMPISEKVLASQIEVYWKQENSRAVELPPTLYCDIVSTLVFAQGIGGRFNVVTSEFDNHGNTYIQAIYDKDYTDKVKEFSTEIRKFNKG